MSGLRARIYSTEAITLRRMDFGEADRILTVITPAMGKLRLLAKGVRRPTSRLAGHIEPFSLAQLMVAKGRDLDLVTQASTLQPFRGVREHMVKAAQAFHLAELVDGFLQDWDAHPEVFDLFQAALSQLDAEAFEPPLVARYFEVQLLDAVGYRPELANCLRCGAAIEPVTNGYSVSLGGVLCATCGPLVPDGGPIRADALKLMRFLQRTPMTRFHPVVVPTDVMGEAERLLRRQLEFTLERRLRATDFVHQAQR